MSESNRRPIIIAGIVAAVVVLVFVLGVGFGGGDRPADQSLQSGLAGIGPVAPLTTEDLLLAQGSCAVSGEQIRVRQGCTFIIAEFGGAFDLGPVTKRGALDVLQAPGSVTVTMVIEGTEISQELDQGDSTDLTVGRAGASLDLACPSFTNNPCFLSLSAP